MLIRSIMAFVILMLSFNAYSKQVDLDKDYAHMNEHQLDNLNYAYNFGEQFKKDGNYKDIDNLDDIRSEGLGYIFAAIMWKESAGTLPPKKAGHHSYGLFQNYITTVRSRFKQQDIIMTDTEIIQYVSIRENSAKLAHIELSTWLKVRKGNMFKSLASYNAGYQYEKATGYANEVLRRAEWLKKNNKFKITRD